jgi:hypothetical protein
VDKPRFFIFRPANPVFQAAMIQLRYSQHSAFVKAAQGISEITHLLVILV